MKFSDFRFFVNFGGFMQKKLQIRIYAMDIHKVIHKNGIHNYSPAFRALSYRQTSKTPETNRVKS